MENMENMARCGLGRWCGWWIGKCFNLMIANLSGNGTFVLDCVAQCLPLPSYNKNPIMT